MVQQRLWSTTPEIVYADIEAHSLEQSDWCQKKFVKKCSEHTCSAVMQCYTEVLGRGLEIARMQKQASHCRTLLTYVECFCSD